jgi:AcrR family transcriptional regulator
LSAVRERRYGGLSLAERRAARRARLTAAALRLFGGTGYSRTTIPEVCSEAGVTTAHFYEEFASREALLIAVYDDIASVVFARVRAALRDLERSVEERLRAANAAYFEYLTEDPNRARLYALEIVGVSAVGELHQRAFREKFVRQSAKALQWGGPGRSPLDERLTSVALAGASTALLVEWLHASRPPAVERLVDEMTALWLRVLAP